MNRRRSLHVTLAALSAAALFTWLPPIGAQAPAAGDHTAHLKAWDAHKAMAQSSPYRTMNWSFVGPTNISGRISDVAVADRGFDCRRPGLPEIRCFVPDPIDTDDPPHRVPPVGQPAS